MNPLSNLIKMMDTRLNQGRSPQRNRMKNLQLNMSLVLEEANELNESRNVMNDSQQSINSPDQKNCGPPSHSPESGTPSALLAPISPQQSTPVYFNKQETPEVEHILPHREGRLQSIARKSTLKQQQKQKFHIQEEGKEQQDILNFTKINKDDLKILLHDSDEDKRKSQKSSPRSSEGSSNDSPRSSDQSSSEEVEEKEVQKKQSKHSVRFSVVNLSNTPLDNRMNLIKQNKKLNTFSDYLPYKPMSYSFNVKLKISLSGSHDRETYYECYEVSKKLIPKTSALKNLFKLKAQGHITYIIETKIEASKDELHIRQRNRTSVQVPMRANPGTPGSQSKRRAFSPSPSPMSSQRSITSENSLSPILTEFMFRAQSKVRMLKLMPIDMKEIMISSSSSSSSGSEVDLKASRRERSNSKIKQAIDIPRMETQLKRHLIDQKSDLLSPLKLSISPDISPPQATSLLMIPSFEQIDTPQLQLLSLSSLKSSPSPVMNFNGDMTPRRQLTKTFGVNKALLFGELDLDSKEVPNLKKEPEIKRQFNTINLQQVHEEDESPQVIIRPSLMRRLPQIQLQDLSFKQKLSISLNKKMDNLLFKLRPFLEDPDDQFDHAHNNEKLSKKAIIKFKILCSLAVGGFAFLLLIMIISVITVSLSRQIKNE